MHGHRFRSTRQPRFGGPPDPPVTQSRPFRVSNRGADTSLLRHAHTFAPRDADDQVICHQAAEVYVACLECRQLFVSQRSCTPSHGSVASHRAQVLQSQRYSTFALTFSYLSKGEVSGLGYGDHHLLDLGRQHSFVWWCPLLTIRSLGSASQWHILGRTYCRTLAVAHLVLADRVDSTLRSHLAP